MMLSFFNAESIGLKLTVTPRIAYYEDYSVKEISKILGAREGTVKSQLSRARKIIEAMI